MDYYKHWKYKQHNPEVAIVWCPTIHDGFAKGFNIKKQVILELKRLHKDLKLFGFQILVMYTELQNPHIMRLLTKVGYDPYIIDLNTNRLWFRKEI